MYARDHAIIATPIGMIRIEGDDAAIAAIRIGADGPVTHGATASLRLAEDQIATYFSGNLKSFTVPLVPAASRRGRELRQGLIAVGYGMTASYGELARQLRSGPRAIGQLCARNPFPIIVPCHRILGAGGVLGSYSAGDGPATKRWLLDHERRHQ